MNDTEWTSFSNSIIKIVNKTSLEGDYGCGLDYFIKVDPSHFQFPLHIALDKFIKEQKEIEERLISANNSYLIPGPYFNSERPDYESEKQSTIAKMILDKQLITRGAFTADISNQDIYGEENVNSLTSRLLLSKAVYDLGTKAVEIFQEIPTMLIQFPNVTIPYIQVMGSWIGTPWSSYNRDTLSLQLRNTIPHFNMRLCKVGEEQTRFSHSYKLGAVFTYKGVYD